MRSNPETRTRSTNRRMTPGARQALWLALVLVLPGGAQNIPSGMRTPLQQPIGQRVGGEIEDSGSGDEVYQEKQLRALNAERQKSMIFDANKLLKLAGELNAEVTSANFESLTRTQLHKLDEIEKLAHGVKEKMRTSVRPMYQQPPLPPIR